MKYREFKKAVEEWGEKYNYKPVIDIVSTYIEIGFKDEYYMNRICLIHKSERFVMDLIWGTYSNLSENAKGHFFEIVTKFAATKPDDREDEESFDTFIYKLEEIQFKTEDFASKGYDLGWSTNSIEEIWGLRRDLKDIIVNLEKYKKGLNKRPKKENEE